MNFPRYSSAAKKGEQGVGLVSRIVSDSFGWIFKRNHQEHDFGIDGQAEVVTEHGHVTGQIVAVQIKCGKSFLRETNKWGYIYRGEKKHLNYLTNYPIPVILIVCEPDSGDCYWTQFRLEEVEPTESGWKTTIPFENVLNTSKATILDLLGEVLDGEAELEKYWAINSLITQASVILFAVAREDVAERNIQPMRDFFDRLRLSREIAERTQGKVDFMFSGYDDDPRELFEVPEVRDFITQADAALPEIFFFLRTEPPNYSLKLFGLCQTCYEITGERLPNQKIEVSFETKPLGEFVMRHCPSLNELCDWVKMPMPMQKKIFFDIVRLFGFEPPRDA